MLQFNIQLSHKDVQSVEVPFFISRGIKVKTASSPSSGDDIYIKWGSPSGYEQSCDAIARALINLGPAAVPDLIAAFETNEQDRSNIAMILGKIGPPAADAGPALLKDLADGNVRIQVITALKKIAADDPSMMEAIDETLNQPHVLNEITQIISGDDDAYTVEMGRRVKLRERMLEAFPNIGTIAANAAPALASSN